MQLGFRACAEATIRQSVNIQIQWKFSAPIPCVLRIFLCSRWVSSSLCLWLIYPRFRPLKSHLILINRILRGTMLIPTRQLLKYSLLPDIQREVQHYGKISFSSYLKSTYIADNIVCKRIVSWRSWNEKIIMPAILLYPHLTMNLEREHIWSKNREYFTPHKTICRCCKKRKTLSARVSLTE